MCLTWGKDHAQRKCQVIIALLSKRVVTCSLRPSLGDGEARGGVPASPLDGEAYTAGWEHETSTFLGTSVSWAPSCALDTWLLSLVSRSLRA